MTDRLVAAPRSEAAIEPRPFQQDHVASRRESGKAFRSELLAEMINESETGAFARARARRAAEEKARREEELKKMEAARLAQEKVEAAERARLVAEAREARGVLAVFD